MPADTPPDIESLRKRHRDLDRQKTTEEANLKNAQVQLDGLQAQAERDYGTKDLTALRAKLAEMEAENDRQRGEYDLHLREIQRKLEEVRKEFDATET